jgi:cytochrome c biogenesis protein CcmG, thiol:disulfide interchange protein DsbE
MKKIINSLPLIALIIVVLIGCIAIYKAQKKQVLNNKLENNKIVAMPEFSLTELYDNNKTLSNLDLNHKLSLVNIFASWCSTCQAEHETLMRLSATGVIDIYGVAWRDVGDNTMRYLEKNGNPYLKVGLDNKGIFTKLLSVKAVPETFIINKEGKIIYRLQGNITDDVVDYIEQLAAQEKL